MSLPTNQNEVTLNGTRGRSCDTDQRCNGLDSVAGKAGSHFLAAGRTGGSEPLAFRPLSGETTTGEEARSGRGHSTDGRRVGFPLDPNPIVELNKLSHAELVEYGLVPCPTLRNIATALSVMALFGLLAFLCALWTQRKAIGFIVLKAGIALLMVSGVWMGIFLADMVGGSR